VFYDPKRSVQRGRAEIDVSRARSGLLTLTFNIGQSRSPRNWAIAAGSNRYRAALVSRQLTPGLISSSPGTTGSPPFIFPALRSLRLSSALGSLRELVVAARDHFDCPDVPVQLDLRCLVALDGE